MEPECTQNEWAIYSSACPWAVQSFATPALRALCRKVTAVIVTRGDHDLSPILAHLPFDDVIVWDNSARPEALKVFGRYAAIEEAKNEIIYTQDDDCIVRAPDLLGQYEDGLIVTNVPRQRRRLYNDGVTLVGWGAVFHRRLLEPLNRYLACWPRDDLFLRECDRVFTGLNRSRCVEVPFHSFDYSDAPERMGSEAGHFDDLAEIRRRIGVVRAGGRHTALEAARTG